MAAWFRQNGSEVACEHFLAQLTRCMLITWKLLLYESFFFLPSFSWDIGFGFAIQQLGVMALSWVLVWRWSKVWQTLDM